MNEKNRILDSMVYYGKSKTKAVVKEKNVPPLDKRADLQEAKENFSNQFDQMQRSARAVVDAFEAYAKTKRRFVINSAGFYETPGLMESELTLSLRIKQLQAVVGKSSHKLGE